MPVWVMGRLEGVRGELGCIVGLVEEERDGFWNMKGEEMQFEEFWQRIGDATVGKRRHGLCPMGARQS